MNEKEFKCWINRINDMFATIKKPRWARTGNGFIGEYEGECGCHHKHTIIGGEYFYEDDVWDIHDTPQDMIRVGDLVDTNVSVIPFIIHSEILLKRVYKDVIKIWTLDSEGNYIKQWEMK